MEEWKEYKLDDFMAFNPTVKLKKATIARKVTMDLLEPHCRDIHQWTVEPYSGGAKFQNGDTIMARITPCLENGKHAFVSFLENDEVAYGSTEYFVMRGIDGVSDNLFVYYLSHSDLFKNTAIKSMVGSSGRQRAQVDTLKNLVMLLPGIEEQKLIAKALSSLDDKIDLNRRINDNLEQQAQALFRSWFIDFNPFKEGKFAESELGMIPEGWRVGTLGDLVEIKYGKDHKKLQDGSIPVFGSGGIMRYAEKPLYSEESVLIPRKGTLNNVIYVNKPFWTVDTMFYTVMKIPGIAKFIYLFVNPLDLASMNSGSAVPSMTTEILNGIKLVIPANEVLKQFTSVVSPLFVTHERNESENRNLAELRDSLLPKLMSGELKIEEMNR